MRSSRNGNRIIIEMEILFPVTHFAQKSEQTSQILALVQSKSYLYFVSGYNSSLIEELNLDSGFFNIQSTVGTRLEKVKVVPSLLAHKSCIPNSPLAKS